MSNVFETVDPRGWTVTCSEWAWNHHVLSARPWMAGWEDEVKATIEAPHMFIFQDADWEDRHIYYRQVSGKNWYIKVVVQVKEEGLAEMITAFRTDSMKSGEKWIWPISSDS